MQGNVEGINGDAVNKINMDTGAGEPKPVEDVPKLSEVEEIKSIQPQDRVEISSAEAVTSEDISLEKIEKGREVLNESLEEKTQNSNKQVFSDELEDDDMEIKDDDPGINELA